MFNNFIAVQKSSQDYYPFGMSMPGRSFTEKNYRYGFNGKEKDDEVKGGGNSLSFDARIYDSRIGNFLSIDPDQKSYSSWSTYNFAQRNPIAQIDANGKGARVSISFDKNGNQYLKVTSTIYVYSEAQNIINQITNIAPSIENEINSSWSSSGKIYDKISGKYLPVVFDVKVIPKTFEEAQILASNNKSNDVNFIHLNETINSGDNGNDNSWSVGNSGSWGIIPTRKNYSFAHEFGHLMGNRLSLQGIPDPNGFNDHPLTEINSVFSNASAPTLNDLKSLNFGLGIINDQKPKSLYALKSELTRNATSGITSKTFGQVNNNKVFKNNEEADKGYNNEIDDQNTKDKNQPK